MSYVEHPGYTDQYADELHHDDPWTSIFEQQCGHVYRNRDQVADEHRRKVVADWVKLVEGYMNPEQLEILGQMHPQVYGLLLEDIRHGCS